MPGDGNQGGGDRRRRRRRRRRRPGQTMADGQQGPWNGQRQDAARPSDDHESAINGPAESGFDGDEDDGPDGSDDSNGPDGGGAPAQ